MSKKLLFFSRLFIILYLISLSKAVYDYIEPSQEFRGLWVSAFSGDLKYCKDKDTYIDQMTLVLDTIKKYNMNALIFHVRINNDALYESELNPINRIFHKNIFSAFDPINWIIEEAHKRGIEFHA